MFTEAKAGTQDQNLSNSGEVQGVHHATGPKNSAEQNNEPAVTAAKQKNVWFEIYGTGVVAHIRLERCGEARGVDFEAKCQTYFWYISASAAPTGFFPYRWPL